MINNLIVQQMYSLVIDVDRLSKGCLKPNLTWLVPVKQNNISNSRTTPHEACSEIHVIQLKC